MASTHGFISPAPENGAGAVERARQMALAVLQLLVLLEVVREWTRADVADLAEAAEQAEALSVALDHAARVPPSAEELLRARKAIAQVHPRLDGLLRLAPLQAPDPASADAMSETLRRLRVSCDALQAGLDRTLPLTPEPPAAPAYGQAPPA